MEYAYKFRIYPTPEQEDLIVRTFGCVRFVYNYYLQQRKIAYQNTGRSPTRFDQDKDLTRLKQQEDTLWLKEVDKSALQCALKQLDMGYKNFFRGSCAGGIRVGYPKFRSRKNRHQSYQTNSNIKVFENTVQLPKLGKVKCRISKEVVGRIICATVSRSPSNKYYVSLCCTEVDIEPLSKTNTAIGLDMGIKSFAVTSNGVEYYNPKYLAESELKLERLQRKLSRKTKGSGHWEKNRLRVARLQEHITNQRTDMLHKLSTDLIRQNDVICIEDLAVREMVKKHAIAKAISDASWGKFRQQLEYKSKRYGKRVVVVDRFYPSSQLCSECGMKWAGTKDLSVRKWVCPTCGAAHDRDINAAKNILNEGLRLLT